MHGPQHAGNEFVDPIAFLYKRHQSGDPALIVRAASKMGEDKLLKGVNLVLESHEIRYCLIAGEGSASTTCRELREGPTLHSGR